MSCEGCKFWSERMAEARDGRVLAYCLNEDTDLKGYEQRMVHAGCDKRVPGLAIDTPGYNPPPDAIDATPEEPRCFVCHKRPEELDEYREAAAESEMTADDYLREEEGTFNPESGNFACTPCYVAIGCPSGPPRWTAP